MATWNNTTKTLAGLALDQALLSGDLPLKLTKAKSGKGKVNATQLASQTDVSEPVQELSLKDAIFYTDDTTVTIPVTLSNSGLQTAYDLYQVGIYAQGTDGSDVLYIIAQTDETNGEEVPSEAESPGFTIDWNFAINNANSNGVEVTLNESDKITLAQGDTRYAKKSDLEALQEEFDSLDISSQLEPYAKKTDVYTKTESDAAYAQKTDVYTKTESDAAFAKKTDVYTKTESDAAYAKKTDVYAKTETYAKTEVYSKTETYSKEEIDQKIGSAGGGGGVIVAASAPEGDASMLWIDTTSGGVSKYWDGSAWVATAAVWG